MKKNLLLALVFVSLTGFNDGEVKATDVQSVTRETAITSSAPIIKDRSPSGKVMRKVGQTVSFSVIYSAEPIPSVGVTKDGKTIVTSLEYKIQHLAGLGEGEVIVTIREAELDNSGKYTITLVNPSGEASATFLVEITE